ncbi:MAG: AraC family transcriptional regulator [Clostridiales bacterium]|nr:AraC family transcriptional regulator [Clostridiales bacterium]
MIYRFGLESFPRAVRAYIVIRRTVWQVADPYHILMFIQKGGCRIEVEGKEFSLQEGDFFFLPANTMYVRRPVGEEFCTIFYAHFLMPGGKILNEDQARQDALEWKKETDRQLMAGSQLGEQVGRLYLSNLMNAGERKEKINRMIAECIELAGSSRLTSQMQISMRLLRMLMAASYPVLDALLRGDSILYAEKIPEKMRQAIAYIHQHESEKISLTQLCDACAISKQQMIRYFKNHLNTTPTDYIIHHKMNRARELFARAHGLSVKEIAGELGYEDQCYFSRLFTKVTGETPSDFRNRAVHFDEKKHISGGEEI